MPFAYYQKLSATRKQIYRASDRVEKVDIPGAFALHETVKRLETALASGSRLATERECQTLVDRLTEALGVGRILIRVFERRPSWATGELHGLYEPDDRGRTKISVWMRTAQRVQIVKFKTFLRTLLHELCHHLDYEHFRFRESFHTEGFYKRESSLLRQLYPSRAGTSERK